MKTKNKTWKFKSIYGEYTAEIKNDKLCLQGEEFTFNKTDVLKIPNISRITTTAGDRVYPISRVSYFIKIGCCEITYKQLQEIQYEFKREETQVQNKTIEMKKYKHTSGKIAIQIADTNLYQVQGSEDKLAEWLLVDSQDWEEIKEPEFKEGDFVTVTQQAYGGTPGWWSINIGDVYKVISFDNFSGSMSVQNKKGNINTFKSSLFKPRFATKEEIQEWETFNGIKIGNYTFENSNGLAKFGCQEFSKSELIGIRKLFNNQIKASITLHPTEGESLILTPEFLTKVIDKL